MDDEEYQEMLAEEEFWWRVENGEIEEYGDDEGTFWAEVIYTNSETGESFKLVHGKVVFVTEEEIPYKSANETLINDEMED